jgi:hypothetical protein
MSWGRNALDSSIKFSDESDNLDIIAFSWYFQSSETMDLVNQDFIYVALVIATCLLYMTFHMESLYLASSSLFNVVMSLPVALVIYRFVFGVTYFSSIHVTILIVVVGIGADDVFVFHDIWEGSFLVEEIENDLIKRLTYTLRRASK